MDMKKILLIVASVAIIACAFSLIKGEEVTEESPINIEVGQEFKGIEYSQIMYVLNYKIADLNGDDVNDVVIIVGEKDNPLAEDIRNADVVFYNGATQKYINADLRRFEGNKPRLELADMTGDTMLDIIFSLNNEKRDKNIRVVTYENESLKEIFKAKNNKSIVFTGNFIDGFKVNLCNKKLNVNKELDLSTNASTLIESGVFDNSGKYLACENSKIKTTGFVEFELIKLTGSMGIRTKQMIMTNDEKNILDEINITWKFEEGKWQIKEAISVKQGNLLY